MADHRNGNIGTEESRDGAVRLAIPGAKTLAFGLELVETANDLRPMRSAIVAGDGIPPTSTRDNCLKPGPDS